MSSLPRAWLLDFSSLDDDAATQLLTHLSDKEIERANSFQHAQRRLSFIASRALAYQALRQTFSTAAHNWIIANEGQPLLSSSINTISTDLPRISISHSGNFALCVIADGDSLIGCDIETHKPRVNMLAIAKQFFTASEYRLLEDTQNNDSIETASALFFQMWTCKEAWLKAQGLGIANGLKHISIAQNGFTIIDNDQTDWQLHITQGIEYSVAIAIKQKNNKSSTNKIFAQWLDWNIQTTQFNAKKTTRLHAL